MTTVVGIAGGPATGGRTSTAIRTAAVRAFPARPRTSARSPRGLTIHLVLSLR